MTLLKGRYGGGWTLGSGPTRSPVEHDPDPNRCRQCADDLRVIDELARIDLEETP